MAVSDEQLIHWLAHEDSRVRSASLDLLSSSYSSDPRILRGVLDAWDRFGTDEAFTDFPLISHLAICSEEMPTVIAKSREMSLGRKLTDRICRCAGKLAEAISVERASSFAPYLEDLRQLKDSSKIFFRVPIDTMQLRAAALKRETSSLELDFEDGQPSDFAIALESLWERGQADRWIREGLEAWSEPNDSTGNATGLKITVLELASRHPVPGYEEILLDIMDREESTAADLATIALVRARTRRTQALIAERFPGMAKSGQLRSLDIIRRMRLPESSELVRFLLPYGCDAVVQNSVRWCEVMLFDFGYIEEWLEAFLLLEETSVQRLVYAIPISHPLAIERLPEDWSRIKHLLQMRLGKNYNLE